MIDMIMALIKLLIIAIIVEIILMKTITIKNDYNNNDNRI